ncbi:hypothetical protein ACWOFO_05835 [Carnobacterium maltaromaticum]
MKININGIIAIISLIFTIFLSLINFLYSSKNKNENIRQNLVPKVRYGASLGSHIDINAKLLKVSINPVTLVDCPMFFAIVQLKSGKNIKSKTFEYIKDDMDLSFVLGKNDDINLIKFIFQDENEKMFIREYEWSSKQILFKKAKILTKLNFIKFRKIENVIKFAEKGDVGFYHVLINEVTEFFKITQSEENKKLRVAGVTDPRYRHLKETINQKMLNIKLDL